MTRLRRTAAAAVIGSFALAAAGCGDDDEYTNELRPPSPIVVTAAVTESGVAASPTEFGAGPISLIVANQTEASQVVTLASASAAGADVSQSTGPINPGDTATVKVDVAEGDYELRTEGAAEPARLEVGESRPSAQDELLLP